MAYTLKEIIGTNDAFLGFLKLRTQMFHQSNVFFRDFHYGIMAYGESDGKKIRYDNAEDLAHQVIGELERSDILRPIKAGSWMLNYPAFRKPSIKSESATKPSSGPAVAKTAIASPSSGLAASSTPAPSNA